MTKLEALNKLQITEWSCFGEELEYVLVAKTEENKSAILNAGFTTEQINEATDNDETDIDIAYLAFNYADARWWKKSSGFSNVIDSTESA